MAYEGWDDNIPPLAWPRYLAFDVGGASANAMEWAAQDPISLSPVFYTEVHKITTNMREMADLALPNMKNKDGVEYTFIAKVGDYENRIALDDMAKYGIRFTNAIKHDKLTSVHKLAAYLHPNPKRPFPAWHPRAGQMGAPLLFVTPACKHLIAELPQQRWKTGQGGGDMKDEMDRAVKHDALDCALYIARIAPAPASIPVLKVQDKESKVNLQSRIYWADVAKQKEKTSSSAQRTKYNPQHDGGGQWSGLLGF